MFDNIKDEWIKNQIEFQVEMSQYLIELKELINDTEDKEIKRQLIQSYNEIKKYHVNNLNRNKRDYINLQIKIRKLLFNDKLEPIMYDENLNKLYFHSVGLLNSLHI